MKSIRYAFAFFFFSFYALADPNEEADLNALKETQNILNQTEKRIEVIKTNPQAQKIDEQVKLLMGHSSEQMYRTAADFLPYILQLGQGDPTKMAEILTKAARNPAAFANSLPHELKNKISDLSEKVKPLPEERQP